MKFKNIIIAAMVMITAYQSSATTAPIGNRVTAIVPYASGGGTDLEARLFSKWIKDNHNVDVVILNRPGAESLIGSREISAADRDGRVIGFHTITGVVTVGRQGVEVTPVSAIRKSALILVVRSDLDVVDYDDFVSKMKTVSYNIGSAGPGHDIPWKQIFTNERVTKEQTKVPFKGAAPIAANLLGGHIDAALLPLDVVREHIIAGKLKPLASTFKVSDIKVVSLQDRYPSWTDISGSVMILPEKVNTDIQSYWAKMVESYVNDPDVMKTFQRSSTPRLKTGPENLNTYINQIDKLFD